MARPIRPGRRRPPAAEDAGPAGLPSREAVREFIRSAPGRVGKREVARHFNLGPEHRVALRRLLKDLASGGYIDVTRERIVLLRRLPPRW